MPRCGPRSGLNKPRDFNEILLFPRHSSQAARWTRTGPATIAQAGFPRLESLNWGSAPLGNLLARPVRDAKMARTAVFMNRNRANASSIPPPPMAPSTLSESTSPCSWWLRRRRAARRATLEQPESHSDRDHWTGLHTGTAVLASGLRHLGGERRVARCQPIGSARGWSNSRIAVDRPRPLRPGIFPRANFQGPFTPPRTGCEVVWRVSPSHALRSPGQDLTPRPYRHTVFSKPSRRC